MSKANDSPATRMIRPAYYFPMLGKKRRRASRHWKKTGRKVPMFGKVYACRIIRLPNIGKIGQAGSSGFQTLERFFRQSGTGERFGVERVVEKKMNESLAIRGFFGCIGRLPSDFFEAVSGK